MSSTAQKLSNSFNDYEALGAHQAICLMLELSGELDVLELNERILKLPGRIPQINFTPKLEVVEVGNLRVFDELSRIFSYGLNSTENPLIFFLLKSSEHYFFVTLFHHSFSDGLGGIEIFRMLNSPDRDYKSESELSAAEEFEFEEKHSFSFIKALRTGWKHLSSPQQNGAVFSDRSKQLKLISFDIHEARAIKRRLKITLNEVYLFCIRELFKELFPQSSSREILVPVNLRPRKLKTTLGNFLMVFPVSLKLVGNSTEEVLEGLREVSRTLSSESELAAYRSARRLIINLPCSIRRAILRRFASSATSIATYVPDLVSPRVFCGAQLVSQFGVPALLPGHELGFCLMTTKDEFSVTVVAAGEFKERIDEVEEALKRAFKKLQA